MNPASAPPRAGGADPPRSDRRWRWLRADEGWSPSEEAIRLVGALAIALVAIGVKLVIVRVLGGGLGYLSYVGAVALAAWIAGWRGGVLTTVICAVAEAGLFRGTLDEFLASPLTVFGFALFLFDGIVVTWITSNLRRAMVRERSARAIGDERLEAQVAAYHAAERDRDALASLQAVTASLAGAATPDEVADGILDRGMMALGARAGGVSRLADDGRSLDLIATRGYPEQAVVDRVRFDLGGRSHLRDAVTGGAPIFLTDPAAWTLRYPESAPAPLPDSPTGGALAVLPLRSGGRTIGTVVFRFATPEALDAATRDLAVRLADQGAQAFDRALAYERERTAREALERSGVRLTFLAETSELLASGVHVEQAASALPRLAIPALADWCAIRLVDGELDLVAAAAGTPAEGASVERLAALAPRDRAPWLAPEGAAAGAVISDPGDWSGRLGGSQEAAILGRLSARSVLVVPIGGPAGEARGWLVFGSVIPDCYGPDDLAMARGVASRVTVAAERSRLFAAVTRFKSTVDVAEDAVYMFDPETLRLTYVNRGGANLVGLDASELDGRSILHLQPAAHEAAFRSRLAEVRRSSGRSGTHTGVLTRGDGREIPVDARLQEVTLPDGAQTVILTARDISDRIEVQARLARIAGDERRKAAELQAVIRAMGEGIMVVDPHGRISLANQAAESILGGDLPVALSDLEDRLRPGTVLDVLPQGDSTDREAADATAPRTVRLEDGRWLEIATYPVDLAGTVTEETRASRIVVLRDVTRAREAEAAREAFLGVLSHELRTPVTTIFGWAKVLQRPGRRPDRAEMLADIEVEADRLYRIVEDLLALTRVEGGIRVEGEPLLVQHLAGPLVASEARRWRGITFEVAIPQDLPAVFGERTYVEQVLRNLVSNAGKYSPSGTVVTVEGEATPDDVVIRVLDRGRGIDVDEADRLFELYYRSASTERLADGAGIGLYIGRSLITAMGGRIWARPRPGGGAEFGFSLARCEDDVVGAPVMAHPAASTVR